ncbi:Uncharacterized protein APZ42_005514 [Daphnia magna]|uniref:Uncharacterized protein n=1 Tax=Daphnia magna TaxID=35525 RepID=A0A164GEK6_9CRUS|nr:Uncharacterized protein APZ42_005514 [Daphnia magna]
MEKTKMLKLPAVIINVPYMFSDDFRNFSWISLKVGRRFLKHLFCSLENLRLAAIVACFLFCFRFNMFLLWMILKFHSRFWQ